VIFAADGRRLTSVLVKEILALVILTLRQAQDGEGSLPHSALASIRERFFKRLRCKSEENRNQTPQPLSE
jgi:hypothetical protein